MARKLKGTLTLPTRQIGLLLLAGLVHALAFAPEPRNAGITLRFRY